MLHINDLPATIIAQILYKAALTPAKRLSEWKEKLPLLAVCREWAKLAEIFVFDHVFVEVSEACTNFGSPIDESTHSAHMSWTSNAELIISHDCILKAKRLTIEISGHTTLDHLQQIVLGILQLDHPIDIDEQTIADVARVMQYFGRNMRGIAELNLNSPAAKNAEDHVYTNLVSLYGGQLQVLRAGAPIPLVFSHFLQKIAVLELHLDSLAVRILPSVCGETLKVLKLDGVPRNFAWHHFRYDMFTRPIVFRQLTILHLSYNYSLEETTEDEIHGKMASGAHNCDQLVFPALTQLVIQRCTPDCDLLYADLPFAKLETVHLIGSFDEISHCCRLKLTWVRDLHVEIDSGSKEAAKVYAVTNHLFTNICIGRTVILEFNFQKFTLDPEHIRWVNLTMLGVVSVNYATICKVIARLPNLTNFETNRLEFGTATVESLAADESLFISADPLLAWGEKLAAIMIHGFDTDCPLAVSACGIQELILNTGALTELSVPEPLESLLNAFIDGYKDSYPHLAIINELTYYSSLHLPGSNLKLSAADGAWFSDTLIDAETTKKLRDYAAILENVPDHQKDWHPDVRSRILNLIDPSLYPLIYDRSWLCCQSSTLPTAALTLESLGEMPGSFEKWCEARRAAGDSGLEYYLPVVIKKQASYASDKFSWLPSEFRVDDNGAVTIKSYINNLHPVKHAALYPVIADVFSKFLPLLEQVLTDLMHPRVPGVPFSPYDCYEYQGPEPKRGRRPYYEYLEELECWEEDASYVDPKPKPFVVPVRPVNPYKLRGRRLQAVVWMSNIELTSKKPTYSGKGWSVAGLDNERIIATGIFFYDVVNIAPCSLGFREPLSAYHSASKANDYHAIRFAYDANGDLSGRPARVSQELGAVDIKDRRCLVFLNTYQYTMPRITRKLTSKPGHCKMLTFYFIDPSTRIPSTKVVPPQQKDLWAEGVLSSEPFRSLPLLVVDGIMAKIDYPISLKDAKKIRLQLEAEVKKKTANVSSKFFEPFYTLKAFKGYH